MAGLGSIIEKALSTVGVTEERVSRAIGKPCGCKERRQKLDNLTRWAYRILTGNTDGAEKYLSDILEEDKDAAEGIIGPAADPGRGVDLPSKKGETPDEEAQIMEASGVRER